MWRAVFLAVGIYLCILGVECLGVEKIVLKKRQAVPAAVDDSTLVPSKPATPPQINIVPPDYAPWSLMATGAVVMIYSFSIPSRLKR